VPVVAPQLNHENSQPQFHFKLSGTPDELKATLKICLTLSMVLARAFSKNFETIIS
jgi:hypothetical protein